jgi:hypothetical protein
MFRDDPDHTADQEDCQTDRQQNRDVRRERQILLLCNSEEGHDNNRDESAEEHTETYSGGQRRIPGGAG